MIAIRRRRCTRRARRCGSIGLLGLVIALSTGSAAADGVVVVLGGYDLHPRDVLVEAGEPITFQVQERERAERLHTVVGEEGAFRSPALAPGETWTLTLSHPGVYRYHLAERPSVEGTVVVE